MTEGFILYTEIGDCYQLTESYGCFTAIYPNKDIHTPQVTLKTTGELFIREYFTWDGASGPAIDTVSAIRGSCEHDALFYLFRQGLLDQKWFKEANNQIEQTCLADGMHEIRADVWEFTLNRFGRDAANPKNRREVLKAPR